jgi:putative FmdB family regulatory protein
MPRYQYSCPECLKEIEVVKSIAQLEERELCDKCKKRMVRILTAVQLSPKIRVFNPHFNHGLGRHVESQRDINEEIARIKGETGKEIVEVGTDTLDSVKKTYKKYTLD